MKKIIFIIIFILLNTSCYSLVNIKDSLKTNKSRFDFFVGSGVYYYEAEFKKSEEDIRVESFYDGEEVMFDSKFSPSIYLGMHYRLNNFLLLGGDIHCIQNSYLKNEQSGIRRMNISYLAGINFSLKYQQLINQNINVFTSISFGISSMFRRTEKVAGVNARNYSFKHIYPLGIDIRPSLLINPGFSFNICQNKRKLEIGGVFLLHNFYFQQIENKLSYAFGPRLNIVF